MSRRLVAPCSAWRGPTAFSDLDRSASTDPRAIQGSGIAPRPGRAAPADTEATPSEPTNRSADLPLRQEISPGAVPETASQRGAAVASRLPMGRALADSLAHEHTGGRKEPEVMDAHGQPAAILQGRG